MDPETFGSTLRRARLDRGWSQSDAAREIGALGSARGLSTASPASLKTQLSRWENDHVAPEPEYRALLAVLFERPELAQPGGPPAATAEAALSPAERLRTAVGAARSVDDAALRLLGEQLRTGRALDARLGAAGSATSVAAQADHLDALLADTVGRRRREAVARMAAAAGLLAGWQALDQDRPDLAFGRHGRAHVAASVAGAPELLGEALAGRSAALASVGLEDEALLVLDEAPDSGPGAAWPCAARGLVLASRGEPDAAAAAFTRATGAAAGPATPEFDIVHADPDLPIDVGALHRLREVALAPHDDDALDGLRRTVASTAPGVRERARLQAGLALALTGRPAGSEEAAGHAAAARELAGRIGSYRVRRLLEAGPR